MGPSIDLGKPLDVVVVVPDSSARALPVRAGDHYDAPSEHPTAAHLGGLARWAPPSRWHRICRWDCSSARRMLISARQSEGPVH